MQDIIVYILLGLTFGIVLYKMYKKYFNNSTESVCGTCGNCDLKKSCSIQQSLEKTK